MGEASIPQERDNDWSMIHGFGCCIAWAEPAAAKAISLLSNAEGVTESSLGWSEAKPQGTCKDSRKRQRRAGEQDSCRASGALVFFHLIPARRRRFLKDEFLIILAAVA